jgi:hypothetical protein
MTFYEVLNFAIEDLLEHGFDSKERLDRWLSQLANSARTTLAPERTIQMAVRSMLERTFKASTTNGKLMQLHRGISEFTLQNIKPKLRAELDRRIHASADLIKLNRQASIARTLQRFAGWATSVPAGGTDVASRKETKKRIRRGIAGLPFEERRVVIDQNFKMLAAVNEIVAIDGGAIAMTWRHVKEGPPAYDARPEHVARDGKIYLLRDSWAKKRGLVKQSVGYTDEIDAPSQLPFCRCWGQYEYTLGALPQSMLTAKGKEALLEAREKLKLLRA